MGIALDESSKNSEVKDFNMKIVYEDDQSLSTSASVSTAHKLINIDSGDVALTALVEEARPVAPIFNDAKTPKEVWEELKRN